MNSDLRLIAETLALGETHRGECPECGRRDTFTMTRKDDGVVYNCYSAGCDLVPSGFGGATRSLVRSTGASSKPEFLPLPNKLQELSDEQVQVLQNTVGFMAEHVRISGVLYAPERRRYAFPIYSPTWERRGYVLRSYDGGYPKSLTHREKDEHMLGWFRATTTDGLTVVVEDIPSAVRLAYHGINAVAMCGGEIGEGPITELMEVSTSVRWAFDDDATRKAVAHHRRWRFYFEDSRVVELARDVKDMNEDEVIELIKGMKDEL